MDIRNFHPVIFFILLLVISCNEDPITDVDDQDIKPPSIKMETVSFESDNKMHVSLKIENNSDQNIFIPNKEEHYNYTISAETADSVWDIIILTLIDERTNPEFVSISPEQSLDIEISFTPFFMGDDIENYRIEMPVYSSSNTVTDTIISTGFNINDVLGHTNVNDSTFLQYCWPFATLTGIQDLKVDNNDNVWITAFENGIYKYSQGSFTILGSVNPDVYLPIENRVFSFEFDENDNLWIPNEKRLIKFDGLNYEEFDYTENPLYEKYNFYYICKGLADELIISAYYYHEDDPFNPEQKMLWFIDDSLQSVELGSLAENFNNYGPFLNTGDAIYVSAGNSILKYNGSIWTELTFPGFWPNIWTASTYFDINNNTGYFGSSTKNYLKIQGGNETVVELPEEFNFNSKFKFIDSFTVTPDGTLWIGANNGLIRSDGSVYTLYRFHTPQNEIWSLDSDSKGNLFCGLNKVVIFNENGIVD